MKPHRLMTLCAGSLLLATLTAPAMARDLSPVPPNAPVISPDGSLYREFGGHDGLVRIMDDLFVNINADSRIAPFFEPKKIPHIKAMLVEQVCEITGGGCTYSGRDMAKVHGELGIKQADFYALVEDLQKAMTANHVSTQAQDRLLAALAPQSRVIIYKPGTPDPITPPPAAAAQ
jgi:hemoglobin